ncbi:small acid-soluble spore protein SspI [Rubeoparvulum massiliense]|uniref:small acid-soluble spore protein SspI n=1 Tax=Rubeoparvulum massiliense TaxID=1631346 RepID=UPI00065E6B66|nr:small acid-soluble spore protein SspI [Rubeoparvulum massiliense]
MDIDLRTAVKFKMRDETAEEIEATINDAVYTRIEKALPGLGVMFELYWNICNQEERGRICKIIEQELDTQ